MRPGLCHDRWHPPRLPAGGAGIRGRGCLDHAVDHAVAFPPGRRLHGTGPENTIFDRAALPGATQLRRYGFALLAIILVTMLGFLQRIFSTVELGFNQWAICAGIALSLLVVEELIKVVHAGQGGCAGEGYPSPAGDGGVNRGSVTQDRRRTARLGIAEHFEQVVTRSLHSRRGASSDASSLKSSFSISPSTRTVFTLEMSAAQTTAPTGSIIGATFTADPSMMTTSVFPGVSEPVRSEIPATSAPPIVAHESASR